MRVPSLRAFQAQLALMIAFVQITDVGLFSSAFEGGPDPIVRRGLVAIHSKIELRIGAKVGGNLFRFHLVDVVGISF